jgi:hypothetical protein
MFISTASPPPIEETARLKLRRKFRLLASIRWDNHLLVPYWRITLNALASADHKGHANLICGCPGHPRRTRLHSYWECPVAQGVITTLRDTLQLAQLPYQFDRSHLWLLKSPDRKIPDYFWAVLAISTIAAMDYGRRLMAKQQVVNRPQPLHQLQLYSQTRLVELLHDFQLNALIPSKRRRLLPPDTFAKLFGITALDS